MYIFIFFLAINSNIIKYNKIDIKTYRIYYGSIFVDFTYLVFKENSMIVIAYVQSSLTYIFNDTKFEDFCNNHVCY